MKKKIEARARRKNNSYAPPEKYAHLSYVKDAVAPGLICIFVGLNPGVETARQGHAFAGPTNHFWPLLFESGCVSRRLSFRDDQSLPKEWALGLTNLIRRPTATGSELSADEMVDAVIALEARISDNSPVCVCLIGKGIYESIYFSKTGRKLGSSNKGSKIRFQFGWQDEYPEGIPTFGGSRVFVMPSTSGRVAAYSRGFRKDQLIALAEFINSHRKERGWTIGQQRDDINAQLVVKEEVKEEDEDEETVTSAFFSLERAETKTLLRDSKDSIISLKRSI